MKKIIFIDTETTGFGKEDSIIQFGAVCGSLDETTGQFYNERVINQYINTDNNIPEQAFAVHGISKDTISKFGYMNDYIKEFIAYINKADLIVCHNAKFDIRMIQQEINKLGIEFIINPDAIFCTMESTKHLTPDGKFPKLQALHMICFQREFEAAHDALADITATKDCFLHLVNEKKINPFKIY